MVVPAVAPAVLGAVVHLAVLVGRPAALPVDDEEPELLDAHGLSRLWETAPPTAEA